MRRAAASSSSIDPRRTRNRGDRRPAHRFIRPGADVFLLLGMVHTLFDEGLVQPGPPGRARARASSGASARSPTSRPRRSRRAAASTRRRSASWRATLASTERAAVYGRIGTCTQEYGSLVQLAGRRAQRADRPPRCAGRRDVPEGAGVRGQHDRQAGHRPRHRHRPPRRAASSGAPEVFGELPMTCLAEEIETPGAGPGEGADHGRRQPGAVGAERRAHRGRARAARVHGQRRHLPQRDLAPRRRDPARPVAARGNRTTTWRSRMLSWRNHARYSAAVFEPRQRAAARVADVAAADRASCRAAARTPTSTRSTTRCFEDDREAQRRRARRGDRCSALSRAARARSASSSSRCAAARTATASAATPDGLTLAKLKAAPDGIDLGALHAAHARDCCARRRARSSSRRRSLLADLSRAAADLARAGARARHRRAPPGALEQQLDAQPAGARQGAVPLHRARESRRTRSAWAWPHGRPARISVAGRPRRSRPRSRSATR